MKGAAQILKVLTERCRGISEVLMLVDEALPSLIWSHSEISASFGPLAPLIEDILSVMTICEALPSLAL